MEIKIAANPAKREKYSAKDFNLDSISTNAKDRINQFRKLTDELYENQHEIYWIEAKSGLKPQMKIRDIITKEEKDVISFVSNDYLGMSQREETIYAGIEALKKYGTGACAAPIIGGYMDIHRELEEKIADFTGQEAAMVFSSGFGTNTGTLNALLGKDDLALIDNHAHISMHDGLRSTNAKYIGHNDLNYLELVLKREQNNYHTKMVIIDGLYSQDGDLGSIPEIMDLCRKYDAILYVDDAHGIGVFGENGKGVAEHYNVLGKIDIIMGTFSKAFGLVGGFVASSKATIQYLKHYANSTIFSTSLTPQIAASALKVLDLIKTQPEIRNKLWDNVNHFKNRLIEKEIDFGKTVSPIFPIMIRDSYKTKEVARLLHERGIYANGIVYPAVRNKEARIRVTLSSLHEKKEIDLLVDALCIINNELF